MLLFTDYGGIQEFRSKRLEASDFMAELYNSKCLIRRRVPRHCLDLDIIALRT